MHDAAGCSADPRRAAQALRRLRHRPDLVHDRERRPGRREADGWLPRLFRRSMQAKLEAALPAWLEALRRAAERPQA